MDYTTITNLRTLREIGYPQRSIKDEMRDNLIKKLSRNEKVFPGIIGYDKTVIPEIVNAILSQHDFILLGPVSYTHLTLPTTPYL